MSKKDFEEENINLQETLKDLESDLKTYEAKAASFKDEVDDRNNYDYEDVANWQYAKQRYDSAIENVKHTKEIKKTPYFGRFDLSNDDGQNAYYVGKESYFHDGEQKIVDWRTELGNLWYSTDYSGNKYIVEGKKYTLALKRAIQISNSKLLKCETTYDSINAELDGEIVDSFLVDVLRDKRREKKVTDIIKTIQNDQNKILRLPKNESFVVQGCAGSGKTMILLHRLSYILFNKLYLPDDVLVVTPNKYFDSQINDLSKELGLNDIERKTVDELYLYLINLSSITRINSPVESEAHFNHELLAEVYSDGLLDRLVETYNNKVETLFRIINEKNIYNILKNSGLSIPKPENYAIYGLVNTYEDACKSVNEFYLILNKKKKLEETEDKLNEKLNKLIERIKEEFQSKLIKFNDELNKNLNENEKLNQAISENKAKILEYEEKGGASFSNKDNVLNYDYIYGSKDEIAVYICNKCIKVIQEIEGIKLQLQTIPVYNFIRRNQLQRKLNNFMQEFNEASEIAYDEFMSNHPAPKFTKEINECNKKIELCSTKIGKYDLAINKLKESMNKISNIIDGLDEVKNYSDFYNLLDAFELESFKDIKKKIEKDYEKHQQTIDKLSDCDAEIQSLLKNNEDFAELEYDELVAINEFISTLKKYSYDSIKNEIINEINSNIKLYDSSIDEKVYRHQLYLELLFSSLYYSNKKINKKLVCFDEAQDLSSCEYKLFSKYLKNDCVFNMYGDTNQAVNDYESIYDWNKIECLKGNKPYVLNQNYRNSYQITEYCNNYFGSEIYPIGIKGDSDVIETDDFSNALSKIKAIKQKDEYKRCAVIVSNKYKTKNNNKFDKLSKTTFNLDGIMPNKINVLDISSVKGLEFDAVLVVDSDMEVNEEYISFTRALDNLIIYRP